MDSKQRAQRAREVLDNPTYQEAFEKVESDLVKSLRNVGMADRDKQQCIAIAVQVLGRIESHFTSIINGEKVEEFNASLRAQKKKRFGVI